MTGVMHDLATDRLMAIVRGRSEHLDALLRVVTTLAEEGVRIVEVSLTTPGALAGIATLRSELGSTVRLGAGTITNLADAKRARDAGAEFLLTPGLPEDLQEITSLDVETIIGALSPTEVGRAVRAGASAVKVFPVSVGGPEYLEALHGPYPNVPLVAVGGIGLDDAAGLLSSGAFALGVGSPLVGNTVDSGDTDGLRARARAFREAVDNG